MEQVPASFGERRGMVWVGSGHSDNLKALEFATQVTLPPVEHDPSTNHSRREKVVLLHEGCKICTCRRRFVPVTG